MESTTGKILIIDDDPGIGEMLKTLLEFDSYEVRVLDKPLQASEKIQAFKPDLVILDVRLSGVDGTEVCRKLKQEESTRDVPIIMMSALSGAAEICENAGANGFISKPFEMEDLLKKVKTTLSAQKQN